MKAIAMRNGKPHEVDVTYNPDGTSIVKPLGYSAAKKAKALKAENKEWERHCKALAKRGAKPHPLHVYVHNYRVALYSGQIN